MMYVKVMVFVINVNVKMSAIKHYIFTNCLDPFLEMLKLERNKILCRYYLNLFQNLFCWTNALFNLPLKVINMRWIGVGAIHREMIRTKQKKIFKSKFPLMDIMSIPEKSGQTDAKTHTHRFLFLSNPV